MRCDPGGGCVQSHGLMSGGTSVNPTTGSTSAFPTEGPETVFAFIHPNALEHRLDRCSPRRLTRRTARATRSASRDLFSRPPYPIMHEQLMLPAHPRRAAFVHMCALVSMFRKPMCFLSGFVTPHV